MPSSERLGWDSLVRGCEELGLERPYLEPARLGGMSKMSIGRFNTFGTVMKCIDSCMDFCAGYKYRMKEESQCQLRNDSRS